MGANSAVIVNGYVLALVIVSFIAAAVGELFSGKPILCMGTVAKGFIRRSTAAAKCNHGFGGKLLTLGVF